MDAGNFPSLPWGVISVSGSGRIHRAPAERTVDISMKAVFASKFYYRRAGLETYLFNLKGVLERRGHRIIPFSTDYRENEPSPYSDYFCRYYELSSLRNGHPTALFNAFLNLFYNREAYRKAFRLIRDTRPAFLQGFGMAKHLTHSVFRAAKDLEVKTLMRLSDYALLCPSSSLLDGKRQLCTPFRCTRHDNLHCIKTRCIKGSLPMSVAGFLEIKAHQAMRTYFDTVDHFIAPSRFIRGVFIDRYGLPPDRISYCPVFFDTNGAPMPEKPQERIPYVVYAGRLSPEKGILTFIEAAKGMSGIRFKIAGDGPQSVEVQKAVGDDPAFELMGHLDYPALATLIAGASCVVLPSECYENSPNIVLEAYAQATPVVGSDIGGIPELIEDGETGWLFETGNAEDLKDKIARSVDTGGALGQNGYQMLKERFDEARHYDRLMGIYDRVIHQ